MSESTGTRINKFLSKAGFCSRREADKLIKKNKIKINGKVPLIGTKVMPGDKVSVNNQLISLKKEKFVYIAFNKPKGIVCTTDTKREKNNIIDFINYPKRIFPINFGSEVLILSSIRWYASIDSAYSFSFLKSSANLIHLSLLRFRSALLC